MTFADYAAAVLADSPQAYWKLQDVAASGVMADASPNGRHGLYGSAAAATDGPGGESALNLNGLVSGIGETPWGAWANPGGALSIAMWVRVPIAGDDRVYYGQTGTTSAPYFVGLGGGTKPYLNLRTSSGGSSSAMAVSGINDGLWRYVVVTWDGTTIRIYIDGTLDNSGAKGGVLETRTAPIQIGGRGGNYANGDVSHVSFFNTALSGTRIAELYTTALASGVGGDTAIDAEAESDALVVPQVSAGFYPTSIAGEAESDADAVATEVVSAETHNREGGRWRSATGTATWEPYVADPPAGLELGEVHLTAQAFTAPVVGTGGASYAVAEVEQRAPRDRILVGGHDVTFFRDAVTPLPSFQLQEPLLYGPATLILPQVSAAFETPGVGDLDWLVPGATVKVQRVDPTTGLVVATDYKGVVLSFGHSGADLSVQLGGEASGRAALRQKQVPIFFWKKDLGRMAHDALRGLRLPFNPYLGPVTGIEATRFGGMGFLEYVQQLCAMAWTRAGNQWTLMPDEATGKYEMFRKDRTTIAGTVYCDDARQPADLVRDITEEPNRIYMTGVTPEGLRVRFGRYPGLKQTTPPPYPMNDGSSFGAGTTDADTDTGDGVTILINRLFITKYLDRTELPGGYDADVTKAVKDLQKDGGLNRTGIVNRKTWNVLYDLTSTGFSLRGAHIGPAAELDEVRPWNLSPSGARISRNPTYNSRILHVDRNVDAGTGFERGQLREWAEKELEDAQTVPNYVGTITFNAGGLVAGTHNPGDPLTEADLMDARDLRPGMNLWLPLFAGGIIVHVSAVEVGDSNVRVTVDTRARDAIEVWEVIARNREARRSLRRAWLDANRSSRQTKDSTAPWDEVGGILGDKVALRGGHWTVFPVVAGQEGTIQKLRVDTNPNAEYVLAVFGRRIYPAKLRRMIGNPLTRTGSKRWERESIRDQLDASNVLLYVAGSDKEPLGYWPKKKTGRNDNDNAAADLTGRWVDDASFPYRCFPNTVLWVAVWADRDSSIPAGRIMWPLLEAGT